MRARAARFEGDPADVDARLERLRSALDAGTFASELAGAKLLMLVDRGAAAQAVRCRRCGYPATERSCDADRVRLPRREGH